MSELRLSKIQQHALALLQRHPEWAYVHGGHETFLDGAQVAMGWRTAFALERRGLVAIPRPVEEFEDVVLTEAGKSYAIGGAS